MILCFYCLVFEGEQILWMFLNEENNKYEYEDFVENGVCIRFKEFVDDFECYCVYKCVLQIVDIVKDDDYEIVNDVVLVKVWGDIIDLGKGYVCDFGNVRFEFKGECIDLGCVNVYGGGYVLVLCYSLGVKFEWCFFKDQYQVGEYQKCEDDDLYVIVCDGYLVQFEGV